MPRLMLLHGFPLDGRMWDAQRGMLPAAASTPTLYSLGNSMEAWATNVLAGASDESLIVVGASMGGPCALEMARQAGDRVAGLVLVGSKAEHRPEPDLRDGYIAALREGGVRRVWSEMVGQFFGPAAARSVVAAAEAIAMEQDTDELIRATQVFHGRPDYTDVAANWRKPFLVIGGDQDGAVSRRKMRAAAETAPFGRLHVIRESGHFPNMERPAEFNSVLGDFVRSTMH